MSAKHSGRPRRFSGQEVGILVALAALVVVFSMLSPQFMTASNAANIGRQVSVLALISIGMTFVILTGGIDLTVGSTVALTGLATAGLMVHGHAPVFLSMLGGLLCGGLIGFANGVLVTGIGIAPFVATLGTMTIVRGLGFVYSRGYPIYNLPAEFSLIGGGTLLGIPAPVVILACTAVLAWIVLANTPFGRYVYAVGGNEEAARFSGVKTGRVKLSVYVISGFLSGLAGVVLTSRLASALPTVGTGYELDAIAAVIIGGASLFGGSGTVLGTLLGALVLGVLQNGLNLLNVDSYVMQVISGAVIILAVVWDVMRQRVNVRQLLRG